MKTANINLYSFAELGKNSQEKAIEFHFNFMNEIHGECFTQAEVVENIEINEYLFFKNGKLANCITYTGKHTKAGITELKLNGEVYIL